jgi:type I restriction enzyme M protein
LLNGVGFGSSEYYVLRPSARLLPSLLYHFITSPQFKDIAVPAMTGTGGLQRVPKGLVEEFRIPLPPLEVQEQIVAQIEGYQKVIDGARQVLDGYRPSVVIDPSWPVERLGDLFQTKSGTTPARDTPAYFEDGHIPWVKTLDLNDDGLRVTDECVTDLALSQTHLDKLPIGTVLVAMYGGLRQIGRTGVLEIEATCNQAMTALLPSPRVDPYFLNAVLISKRDYWRSVANSTRKDPNITKSDVLNFKLPLPDLGTQRAIVTEIKAEQALVQVNRELIRRMAAKIKAAVDRVWGSGE